MVNQAEDLIRETFQKLGDALGIHIDIPDEMIANLAATFQADIDRLEAVDTERFSFLNELALAFRRGEKNARPSQLPVLEGIRAVLAHLTTAGRLVPAGGMALTAEHVEKVRTAREALRGYRNFEGSISRGHVRGLIAAVDALFPAIEPAAVRDGSDLVVVQRSHTAKAVQSWMTLDLWTYLGKNDKDFDAEYERQGFGDLWATLLGEVRALVQATTPAPAEPAEDAKPCGSNSVTLGWCKLTARHEGLHTNGTYFWGQAPAPADPAEEETKAEACMGGGDMHPCVLPAGHAGVHTDSRGLRWNNPAASPVVPAPTETSAIGQAAVALRAALDVVDPLEDGDWEHAWRTVEDLEDCASRAEAIATTETGPWQTLDAVPTDVRKVRDGLGGLWKRNDLGRWLAYTADEKAHVMVALPVSSFDEFAPFVAAEEGRA